MYDFIRTDQPSVNEQRRYDSYYPDFDLQAEGHIPLLIFNEKFFGQILAKQSSKYFTARLVQRTYFIESDGNYKSEVNILKYVPCSDLLLKGYRKEDIIGSNPGFFDAAFDKFLLCVDKDPKQPLLVTGQAAGLHQIISNINIYPCSLDSGCVPTSELSRLGFIFSRAQKSTDLNNFENPVTTLISADDYFTIDPSQQQYYISTLAQYKIIDSKGFLLPETVSKVYSQIEQMQPTNKIRLDEKTHCTLQELDSFECQAYVTLSFQSGGQKYTIHRKYKSLLETIGDIGGINEITLFVAGMIYYLFHKVAVKKFLVWQVFQFKKELTKV